MSVVHPYASIQLRVFRLCAGALAASLAAAVTGLLLGLLYSHRQFQLFPAVAIGLIVALPHAFLLGIPFYLIVNKFQKVRCQTMLLGGFALALLPQLCLHWAGKGADFFFLVTWLGLPGMVGGFAFWFILKERNPSENRRCLSGRDENS